MVNLRKKKFIIIFAVLAVFTLLLSGCGGIENDGTNVDNGTLNQPNQEETPMPEEQMQNENGSDVNTEEAPQEKPLPENDMNGEF